MIVHLVIVAGLVFTIVYNVELDVVIVMSDTVSSSLSPGDVIIQYSLVVLY